MRASWGTAAALALVALSAAASGAIVVSSQTTLETGVLDAPLAFGAGSGASNDRYFTSFSVSPNATSYSASIKSRVGGDATVKTVVTVTNPGAAARTVTLRGDQVSNANVLIHTWTVKNGTTTVATLDMKDGTPTASFTLPAGTTYDIDMRMKVAKGVSGDAAAFSSSVWTVLG